MDEPKRARRIRDKLRMKAKARKVRPWDEKATNADHLASCSCYMCGNPRKYFGDLTVQELKHQDYSEE